VDLKFFWNKEERKCEIYLSFTSICNREVAMPGLKGLKMKRLLVLLFVLMISVTSCMVNKENEMAKENGSSSFQPEPLDDEWNKWLVGEWEGSADSNVGIAKVWMNIDFGINGQFLIMEGESIITERSDEQRQYLEDTLGASDEDIENDLSSTFKSLEIRTIDPKTGEVIGYLFDSLRCIAEGRGRRQGNKEIIEWKWSATAQGATSVYIIEKNNDNKFTLNHKYILPNGNKMEDKIEMTRKE
jgi:hypothetical protein